MSDRQDSRNRPCAPTRASTARALGPQRSDLSSGGGQVRQSNRSGLSKKPDAGDSSRQDDGVNRDGRNHGRDDSQVEMVRGSVTGAKSQRTSSGNQVETAQGDGSTAQGSDAGSAEPASRKR
jgi:hypothetical protein